MNQLLQQKQGKYQLSELGNDAYNLLLKITTYSTSATTLDYLRKQLPAVTIANAILWATALLTVSIFEGRPQFITTATFATLWTISNITLYTITQRAKR